MTARQDAVSHCSDRGRDGERGGRWVRVHRGETNHGDRRRWPILGTLWACLSRSVFRRTASTLRSPRGMPVTYPPRAEHRRQLLERLHRTAARFGYELLELPVCEFRSTYAHTLGTASEIVQEKQFFTVQAHRSPTTIGAGDTTPLDASETGVDELVLRPEGTAGVLRTLLHDADGKRCLKASSSPSVRFRYAGPMFRHERPQRGRLRQFTQFGVECVERCGRGREGAAHAASLPRMHSVLNDVECVVMAAQALRAVGLDVGAATPASSPRPRAHLRLNSLGHRESRTAFTRALAKFLTPRKAHLSPASQQRLERGEPEALLRILDSKHELDRRLLREVRDRMPQVAEFWDVDTRAHFEAVCAILAELSGDALPLSFSVDPLLVRGLDYYDHTVFEFVGTAGADEHALAVDGAGGTQHTILAGGRYDSLLAASSGAHGASGGIGWAAGIERLEALLGDAQQQLPPHARPIYIAVLSSDATVQAHRARDKAALAMQCALRLRQMLQPAHPAAPTTDPNECPPVLSPRFGNRVGKHLSAAADTHAIAALILGDDELERGQTVTVKNLDTGEQHAHLPLPSALQLVVQWCAAERRDA
ncbi:hypothetical protein CDCA_CDCA17G4324 [Cyanidium caldarium]|uniref:histidine--tRNA ligase n=1 Tax=Cyanidium caldarium TaxID=2771 RepID=A0AAV9J173_CYACA|nr:hypothetical protein CDCA_CDCA17G4324 [Cyanidium caldarium]